MCVLLSEPQRSQSHFLHPELISINRSIFFRFYQSLIYAYNYSVSNNICLQSKLSYSHSLSALQLVRFLQFPHILLQGWVLIKVIQHITIQSLERKVVCHFSHIKFNSNPVSTFSIEHFISYLHEQFDMLIFPQEIFAESHPL